MAQHEAADAMDSLANKISDLKRFSEDKKSLIPGAHPYPNYSKVSDVGYMELNKSTSNLLLPIELIHSQKIGTSSRDSSTTDKHNKGGKPKSPHQNFRQPPPAGGMGSFNTLERPASRLEINAMERELEERVRLVLEKRGAQGGGDDGGAGYSMGLTYQPYKESMILLREQILADLGVVDKSLRDEPWLETYIKCASLKGVCDDSASKFADMLSVSSGQTGNIMRKLRLTYMQSFEQMHFSWKALRKAHLKDREELSDCKATIRKLDRELQTKEGELHHLFEMEIRTQQHAFEEEKERDRQTLVETELKMDQMADTLKYLNGIFKTMQGDSGSIKTVDLQNDVYRLEKQNAELVDTNAKFEKCKAQLAALEKKSARLELFNKAMEDEAVSLKMQLRRRDETISSLMEREALHNAEIQKLQKISAMKDSELESMELKDPATSVLCIKCKKSLDDMSNIRAAVLGDSGEAKLRLQCENFRILLPNLRGRQPARHELWLRTCMRAIMLSKMKEDTMLFNIKGDHTKFPAFTYSWFIRHSDGLTSKNVTTNLFLADEDRWGLYYGVKTMSREGDPEALIFWSLLDETYGEDGTQFVAYCMSVALSIGGVALWAQLNPLLSQCGSVNIVPVDDNSVKYTPPNVWLLIGCAKEATKLILTKALAPQILDAIDAIDALKVLPDIEAFKAAHAAEHPGTKITDDRQAMETILASANREPTHINLFQWLRIMLQQMHAEQIHRGAAIRLMFETASAGALTPQIGSSEEAGNYVEYPQFQGMCTTLFNNLSASEIATLYADCYTASPNNKVTADVFSAQANAKGYFTHSMKLEHLPLLTGIFEANSTTMSDASHPKTVAMSTERAVRSKLATIIHRKYAAILPTIRLVMTYVPMKWKMLIQESLDNVQNTLNDTLFKMQTQRPNDKDDHSFHQYVDGIQPFLAYKRLILLVAFVKSIIENPLLPEQYFSIEDLSAATTGNTDAIDQAMQAVETVLRGLEKCVVVMDPRTLAESLACNKYTAFENVRKVLIARRIQRTVKNILRREVAIPRPVRMQLAGGYLCQRGPSAGNVMSHLKSREVILEPWWGQMNVSEIFKFKINYDVKALSLGLDFLSLAQAVSSYCYLSWGSPELADRVIQDLFTCIKAYRHAVPRLRLFAAFLGDGRDLEDSIATILRGPHAVNTYVNILLQVHKETEKWNNGGETGTYHPRFIVDTLFPSVENVFSRPDRREVWAVRPVILMKAAVTWSKSQASMGSAGTKAYTDLLTKLKPNTAGLVDVDDFLWIMLIQWAKFSAFNVSRTVAKAHMIEKTIREVQSPSRPHMQAARGIGSSDESTDSLLSVQKASKPTYRRGRTVVGKPSVSLAVLPLANLKYLVESIYPDGQGWRLADPYFYAATYTSRFITKKANLMVYVNDDEREQAGRKVEAVADPDKAVARSQFSAQLEKFLCECVMWDTPIGTHSTLFRTTDGHDVKLAHDKVNEHKHDVDYNSYQPPLLECPQVVHASNPELLFFSGKMAFTAYHNTISAMMGNILDDRRFKEVMEIATKVQSVRVQLLTLSEIFDANSRVDCQSHVIYNSTIGPEERERLFHLRHETLSKSSDGWRKFHLLISSVCEILSLTGHEFPRDSWQSGAKLPLDKAGVYNVPTRSSLL